VKKFAHSWEVKQVSHADCVELQPFAG
jgi:hypothetical protein